ncbi:MAG: hypothetical protein IKO63_00200 [Paludibacteraceae bacterium]|nr:hypothetical protein [Paludibacteraceae bacterium]
MKNKLLIIVLLLSASANARDLSWDWWPTGIVDGVSAGADTMQYNIGVSALASSGRFAPFWLQSNMNGDISSSPFSGNVSAGVYKQAVHNERWWDYDFAVQLTGRVQSRIPGSAFDMQQRMTTGYFNQLYAHLRLYVFDITAGIKPMIYEMQDTALGMGSMVFSGNSQPLPRITIGIDRYTPVPGCYGYFELKGGLTHAWLADNVYMRGSYIHHKWLALRLGGRLPVNISYELHHAAQWGGISPVYGDIGSDWQSFVNVFLARGGGVMRNDQLNAQGNHVGSQQLMLTGKGNGWEVSMYWQNFFEDNFAAIGDGQNLADGLWGISLKQTRWPYVQGVTYEFMNTTDQSGPWHDRDGLCYAGNDSYYRNSVFVNGWNYFYRSIGTPFITSPLYNEDGTIYTLNSRVRVHHIGVRGDIYGFLYRVKLSYARNYGNDNTSRAVLSDNTAILLEVTKHSEQAWGLDFGLRIAGDFGTQWGNQFGAQITVSKRGIITQW